MPLILSRLPGESFRIFLAPNANTEEILKKLCTSGLEVRVSALSGAQVKLLIDAPMEFLVLRDELV